MAFLLCSLCLPMAAQEASHDLSLPEILNRLAQTQVANRINIRAYTVTREYKLYGDDSSNADSQVIADVSFVPPATKQYSITKANGSGQGEKVVRKVLAHEQAMAGSWEDTALKSDNYDFELMGIEVADGHRCYVLKMIPKRDSKDLIRGRAWVDADSFNVRKIEGELSKSPSWWVKKVQLSLHFSEVQGMWLQTNAKADADVRIFGKRVLTAHDVDCRTGDVVASKAAPPKQQRNPARTVGAGIVIVR